LKRTLLSGLSIGKSAIHGRGCFAARFFPKGRKIAEYAGERISGREAARRMKGSRIHRVCYVSDRVYLDGARGGNGTHYINHSCEPNSYTKVQSGHILFMAKKDIHPGEEITVDYFVTFHSERKRCRCNAGASRGTINRR
jgi:SET domain-containing protein